MDSIGALGLGVVALSMLALSNDDKKETNNKKTGTSSRLFSVSPGDTKIGTESAGGNPEYNEINIKNNMNNYIKYKKKYLKQKKLLKKNMKGGASASAHRFFTGESVEEFIQQVINIYQFVNQEIRKEISITGSSAIAIVLYSLGLFEELAKMGKPADFDFLYDNRNGIIDINTRFENIEFRSGNSESSTWQINNSTHTFDITGINTKSFNKSFILSNFPIRVVNLNTMISDYKSEISDLDDYIQNDIHNNNETNYNLNINKQLRKKNRLQHLNNIIKYITDNKLQGNYGMESRVSSKSSFSFSNLGDSPGGGGLFGTPGTPGTPGTQVASTYSNSSSAASPTFAGFGTPVVYKNPNPIGDVSPIGAVSPLVGNLFPSPGGGASPAFAGFGTPGASNSQNNNTSSNQQIFTPTKGSLFDDI